MVEPRTVFEYAFKVLSTGDSHEKARLTQQCAEKYESGKLPMGCETGESAPMPPDCPSRPSDVARVSAAKVHKRKGAGTLRNRLALIHSFCHIESWAIDLSWDVLLRFAPRINRKDDCNECLCNSLRILDRMIIEIKGESPKKTEKREWKGSHGVTLPLEFYEDWLRVAKEEALHFTLWSERLTQLGSRYGDFPTHDGLWDNASKTSDSLLARLAIVHLILEGRGLDVTPGSRRKLVKVGDEDSAKLLDIIARDEITHVGSGMRWFQFLCQKIGLDAQSTFSEITQDRFGFLKGPFNFEARDQAGVPREWYTSLTMNKT